MYKKTNQKGFTLIELLIVIVIIGILSGVLISVIDPVRQQNRARNASIKAAITKAGFDVNTSRAGVGRFPYETELASEIENLLLDPQGGTATCGTTATLDCTLSVAGTKLPVTCSNAYSGDGSTQCYLHVIAPNVDGAVFRIVGRAYKLNPGDATEQDPIYVFDSSRGFYQCAVSVGDPTANNGTSFTLAIDTSADCVVLTE